MTTDTAQNTLRDELSAAFDKAEEVAIPPSDGPVKDAVIAPEKAQEAAPKPEEPAKPGRTAGRARDEHGKLLPGKAERPEPQQAAPAPERKPIRIRDKDVEWWKYPTTWKKDYAEKWETLPEEVRQEIHRRESDAAFGVSTYKAEYDQIKPIAEAIKPFQPFLQQHGIQANQFIQGLGQSDQTLRFWTEEQKLGLFYRMIQDYGIPLHKLLVRGEDGGVYFNQQYAGDAQQQPQGVSPQDVQNLVEQKVSDLYWQQEIKRFTEARDDAGNPRYPHFETVKPTMHGLLQSRVVTDLSSAYQAALRMPQHAELFERDEATRREAEEKAKAAEQAAALRLKQEQARRAKGNQVSVKGSAPTGEIANANKGRQSLRATIEEAAEAHGGGRV